MGVPFHIPLYQAPAGGISAPGANTDVIDSNGDTPPTWPRAAVIHGAFLRVGIRLATSSVVNVMRTRGGTTDTLPVNGGSAVAADGVATFDIQAAALQAGDTLEVQVETDGAIQELTLEATRA